MNQDARPESRRVVVGVHGSLTSLAALRTGVEQARRREATLVPVLAWSPVGGEFAYRTAPWPPLLEVWRRKALERLTAAFDEALGGVPSDVDVQARVLRGEPGPTLTAVARAGDLLVVGAGRRAVLGRRLPGKTARYCLRRAACAVLLVPPPELLDQTRGLGRREWVELSQR